MPTAMSTIHVICNVIKRFKFEEIESAVMPTFPEISWSSVRSQLVKHHTNFTSGNVAQYMKLAITDAKLQESVLRDRLATLELIDVSRHENRKTWYGHILTGSGKPINQLTNREIQENIQDSFHTFNLNMVSKIVSYDGIIYLSIKKIERKNKRQPLTPTYFALFLGQKYFFSSKKTITEDIKKVIASSIGYKTSKSIKLMGKDLKSLSKLCWKKKQGSSNVDNINITPVYRDAPPEIKNNGVNCIQNKTRKKFAEKCFGENPPTLDLLVINAPDQTWKNDDIALKLPDESMKLTWEFRSHNIATCLTNLIERRILVTPTPYYISNLMMLGKNELTLRSN